MWLNAAAAFLSVVAFLGGLHMLRYGMERMAGDKLPQILHRFVKTPTRGIFTGLMTTSVLQSSAAVTAITVGMVASNSMEFPDALGIILGANVGSTVVPQILTLNLWFIVIPCLILGVFGFLSRNPKWQHPAFALSGFGAVFIGLQTLSLALKPIAGSPWFRIFLQTASHNLPLAILIGMIASATVQSSTATTVITMALMNDGVLTLQSGIAIVLGANVGTCFTSLLAAIGQSRAAKQAAISHVLINVGGVVAVYPLMGLFTQTIYAIGGSPSQQIANANTLFNVASTLIIWPFVTNFANFIRKLLPDELQA